MGLDFGQRGSIPLGLQGVFGLDELSHSGDRVGTTLLTGLGVYYTGRSADAAEGVSAFLEKREADFPAKVSKDLPDFYPWWEPRQFS